MTFYFLSILLLTYFVEAKTLFFGGHSMVAPLKKVLVKRPDESFSVKNCEKWHYSATPNLISSQKEHDAFVDVLKKEGIEIIYHSVELPNHADAIFVHDPVLITNKGAIILRMGKALRRGEEQAIEKVLNANGIPTLYRLYGSATAEGGDILWVDETTLAIGRGFRTNDEGIRQLKEAVTPLGISVVVVELPYDQGEQACLHLQSLISLVDYKTALVYKKHIPVSFVQYLEKNGFFLIDVPEEEYSTMGPNVLAIAPKVCFTIEGNIETKKRLEQSGCKVYTYCGNEISLKAEGGATCLTRPLLRQ